MNIFVLHRDPVICAQYHCDKHIVKMVLETAQILCTALSNVSGDDIITAYRPTHRTHPCVKWAEDIRNWVWLRNLGFALAAEYTHRYGKVHKCLDVLESFTIPLQIKLHAPEYFVQCMPDEHKQDDPVLAYRSYYETKQDKFIMKWTNRPIPEWFPHREGVDIGPQLW